MALMPYPIGCVAVGNARFSNSVTKSFILRLVNEVSAEVLG
jgi:hypothetical protein